MDNLGLSRVPTQPWTCKDERSELQSEASDPGIMHFRKIQDLWNYRPQINIPTPTPTYICRYSVTFGETGRSGSMTAKDVGPILRCKI